MIDPALIAFLLMFSPYKDGRCLIKNSNPRASDTSIHPESESNPLSHGIMRAGELSEAIKTRTPLNQNRIVPHLLRGVRKSPPNS